MAAILWPIIRPFIGYLIGIVALLGAVSGFYFKVKHDAVVAERAKIEQQKEQAIAKANEARDRIHQLCNANPLQCVPSDFFRD